MVRWAPPTQCSTRPSLLYLTQSSQHAAACQLPASPAFLKPINPRCRNPASAANQSSLWGPLWKTEEDKKVLLPLWLLVVTGDHWYEKTEIQMRFLAKWFSPFLSSICKFIYHIHIHLFFFLTTHALPPTFWYWKRTRQCRTIFWSIAEQIHRRKENKNNCGTKNSRKAKPYDAISLRSQRFHQVLAQNI